MSVQIVARFLKNVLNLRGNLVNVPDAMENLEDYIQHLISYLRVLGFTKPITKIEIIEMKNNEIFSRRYK